MDIVLIRHAERRRDVPELDAGLTPEGLASATETAKRLLQLEVDHAQPGQSKRLEKLTAILTSEHAAPLETAGLLAKTFGVAVYKLKCLTPPHSGVLKPVELFREANAASQDAAGADEATLAVIGHEPVISGLLCGMTGKDSRVFDRGEAVWITAPRQRDFIKKRGSLLYAFRHSDYAEKLREKIQTKMTVCTFLAGFTITALIEIIKDPDKIVRTSRVAAAISFTVALGLFIAAVYIYDELSMPPMFWNAGIAGGAKSPRSRFGHDLRLNGALYAHMVLAWRMFFTPAVAFTLAGFFSLLLFNLRYPHLAMRESTAVAVLIFGCLAAVAFAAVMFWRFRPKLATD